METINTAQENILDENNVKVRTELFNKYVLPNVNLVYKLCIRYSHSSSEVADNYNEVLINFYKYIETYNPERSIQTWLHIVTKRYVSDLNQRKNMIKRDEDVNIYSIANNYVNEEEVSCNCMDINNYKEFYNDDILEALKQLKPIYREALLLQLSGYKLNEIMEISFRNGTLKTKNIETVKSRLFLAKQQMKKLIDRNGEARED